MARPAPALRAKYKMKPLMGAKAKLLSCLLACLLLAPAPALAADITIDGAVGAVYGNSIAPDGSDNFGAPTNNTLSIINGADVSGNAYGAHSNAADVTGNRLMVYDGVNITKFIYGGHAAGGYSSVNNSITISGGTLNTDNLDIIGGYATDQGHAGGNSVSISGGTITGINIEIFGGQAAGQGHASGNSISISGGTITGNTGVSIFGGYTPAGGDAIGNSVHISGGNIGLGIISGGWASNGGKAEGNIVRISGGTYNNTDIFVGRGGSSTGNRLIIESSVSGLGNLYATPSGSASNNSFDLQAPLSINGGLRNFQNLNFSLPLGHQTSDPLLTVGGTANIDGATVSLNIAGDYTPLNAGDRVTLISATNILNTPVATGQGIHGLSLLYDLKIEVDGNLLRAEVVSLRNNESIKALMEAQVAATAFLGQAADIAAGPGLYNALSRAKATRDRRFTFGTVSGGFSRYESGSHVNVEGLSMLAGLGWNFALHRGKSGHLLLGAFVEAGLGSYDSHNYFRGYAPVDADGGVNYYGLGALARYSSPFGLYLDASARLGLVETDFNSSDLRDPVSGENAYYETAALYYGGHLGLGLRRKVSGPLVLDIYSKFFLMQQSGDKISMAGERYKFDDISSQRSRTGVRLSREAARKSSMMFAPYMGAAFDYEFNSEAAGTVQGRDIEQADIKGATGMGELGFAYKSPKGRLYIDLGLQGYIGKRSGASGSLQVKWEF